MGKNKRKHLVHTPPNRDRCAFTTYHSTLVLQGRPTWPDGEFVMAEAAPRRALTRFLADRWSPETRSASGFGITENSWWRN